MRKLRMYQSTLAFVVSMSFANVALAGGASAPIIVMIPAMQPGDACIPAGIGRGEETKTSKGDPVIATGVHGSNATRCPDAMFPNLATTAKLPSDEKRKVPSAHCVPRRAKVGDELMIPSYGRATVVELEATNSGCADGTMVKVVGTAILRSAQGNNQSSSIALGQSADPLLDPTESEIQREYDRIVATIAPAQEYHVRHILLRTREDALGALERIGSGSAFADVAAKVSIDSGSSKKGGDLGWNLPSTFIEEFSKSMVSLSPSGIVTEPVKTKFGWHVIELLETKVGRDSIPPLSAVRARIAARLRNLHVAADANARVPVKAVCRKMVAPVLHISGAVTAKGTVVAEMRVENGRVAEILKLSGPSELYPAVTDALNKYECDHLDRPAIAVQAFDF